MLLHVHLNYCSTFHLLFLCDRVLNKFLNPWCTAVLTQGRTTREQAGFGLPARILELRHGRCWASEWSPMCYKSITRWCQISFWNASRPTQRAISLWNARTFRDKSRCTVNRALKLGHLFFFFIFCLFHFANSAIS